LKREGKLGTPRFQTPWWKNFGQWGGRVGSARHGAAQKMKFGIKPNTEGKETKDNYSSAPKTGVQKSRKGKKDIAAEKPAKRAKE